MRSISLIPMEVPVTTAVLTWKVFFHENSLSHGALLMFCVPGVNWTNDGAALWILVISYLWKNLGYTMLLWMAGLSTIPEGIYEAAQVDEAGKRKSFLCSRFSPLFCIVL